MDFAYTEVQEAVRESGAAVLSGHATPERVATVEAAEPVMDRELLSELARANLWGLAIPEEYGGAGLGLLETCALLVEQGRRVAPVPLLSTLVGSMTVASFGSDLLRSSLLPRVARGELAVAVGLPLPGVGAAVTARSDGASWHLDGTLPLVRGATVAGTILVAATNATGDAAGRCTVLAVDAGAEGFSCERVRTTDRQDHGRVRLEAVAVPDSACLRSAELGTGTDIVEWISERYSTGLCALQLGVCQEAVSLAARYVSERRQFGKPLASFQGVALRAADAHIDTEAMSATLWQAAWRLAEQDRRSREAGARPAGSDGRSREAGARPAGSDGRSREAVGRPAGSDGASAEVAVAKWWASEAGHRVVHAVQHLHGGMGADVTYPVHRYFLWAKQIELEMGAGGFQLSRLGDTLLGAA